MPINEVYIKKRRWFKEKEVAIIDDSDSVEAGDQFIVDYRYQDTRAYAKSVIQCIGSHAPYSVNKTKSIIEIIMRFKAT